MASTKYHMFITLLDESSITGVIHPEAPHWKRLCDALTETFDVMRQNRTTIVHYAGRSHDVILLPEELIRLAEQREEERLLAILTGEPVQPDQTDWPHVVDLMRGSKSDQTDTTGPTQPDPDDLNA